MVVAFRAEEFPGDEARKLAIALGLELEETLVRAKRVIAKKSNMVVLQQAKGRRKAGAVDADAETFDCLLDAAHTAMLVFEENGPRSCERWLRDRGLGGDGAMRALLQAMVNAIPATRKKGAFLRPEIALLDRMNDALELGLTFPPDEAIEFPLAAEFKEAKQQSLPGISLESEPDEQED